MDSQYVVPLFSSPSPDHVPYSYPEAYYRFLYGDTSNAIEIARTTPCPLVQLISSIDSIQSAIDDGLYPVLTTDSTGGVYFCYNRYKGVEAIFKPLEEEPYCEENPKKLTLAQFTSAMDRGIPPGCGGLREVAAYYLDKDHFAGVPETVLASFPNVSFFCSSSRVIGSLQMFVPHECSSEDYGPVMFSVDNVQRIAVLDIRLLNMDRHVNNLLVTRNPITNDDSQCFSTSRDDSLPFTRVFNRTYRSQSITSGMITSSLHLVPIDHGYSLPRTSTNQMPEWCWMQWYHSKQPITAEVRAYVEALDAESDVELLRLYVPGMEEEALNTLRVNTLWLKLGVLAGLSLYEMGLFYCRKKGEKTYFQELVAMVERSDEPFASCLMDVGSKYMLRMIQELRTIPTVLLHVCCIKGC